MLWRGFADHRRVILQLDPATHKTLAEVRQFLKATPLEVPGAPALRGPTRISAARCGDWRTGSRPMRRWARCGHACNALRVSRAQNALLFAAQLSDRRKGLSCPFRTPYTREDILHLAETDPSNDTLCKSATRVPLLQAFPVFGDARYERPTVTANSHPYDLRCSRAYARVLGRRAAVCPSRARTAASDKRRAAGIAWPRWTKDKEVLNVNGVDGVIQYRFAGCVDRICERHPLPVLERLLAAFPVVVQGFHSHNSSHYVNHQVATLLEELDFEKFAKPRQRPYNNDVSAESKGDSAIYRHRGNVDFSGLHAE